MNPVEPYPHFRPPKSLWARLRERIFGMEEPEDYEEEPPMPDARRRAALRLDMTRNVRVAVRMNAVVFNDARIAADGLKSGQQQIVNLERATPPMDERILDFLSGVAYALDGSVERIADKVYLFAPANVQIELDTGSEPSGSI
jgi:cell division inhibitor SepF